MDDGYKTIPERSVTIAIFSILLVVLSPLVYSDSSFGQNSNQKNCPNTWQVGDLDNITTVDGTISASVERVSSNSAIFVEDGQVVSSTTLNDIISTWESIIFPTNTNYFGSPPDVDLNCQIEIVILPIDGVGGDVGGYEQGLSSVREALFLDIDDLLDRNRILSHELEHLIHNSKDQFEYIWIDEGAAEMAEFLSFGVGADLESNVNSWTENSSTSLRWWDGRVSDYGSSFLFITYLSEKLGGAPSVRQLVADTSTGGSGVENLANNPGTGSTPIGTSMSEIFANFSAAVTLDSPQGAFGFSEIELSEDCSSGGFCKVSPAAQNSLWNDGWQSSGHTLEGWGLRTFKFTGGNGDPLSILVQPDSFGFEGAILAKESQSGTWTMQDLRVDSEDGKGTGLVHGFGNTTSEVWLMVWYNPLVDDCDFDFANCGVLSGSYPTGSFTVSASLVSSPAEVSVNYLESFDRDGDALADSVEMGVTVTSSAYFETLFLEFSANSNNTEFDSTEFTVSASNSDPAIVSVWFTPQFTSEWAFTVRVRDITGQMQDLAQTLPFEIYNMEPIGSGSISSLQTQTWLPTYFFGGGYDSWGFGLQNGSYGHNDSPEYYVWDLGDGNSSSLKNPVHPFTNQGEYVITLIVRDQGGYYSEPISWNVSVNDNSTPNPEISIDGLQIVGELAVYTGQRVQFSAFGTVDNLPSSELFFTWEWGDGTSDSGKGLFEVGHSWVDGSSEGTIYSSRLIVSDGTQNSEMNLSVRVLNRAPRQVFSESLQTYAVTPLALPTVFVDDDGTIVEYRWSFEEGVNIGGGEVSMSSDFSQINSFGETPIIAWKEPGLKNITIEVTDDDGNTSMTQLEVLVLNQRPVALFERPNDGEIGEAYIFSSSSFDPDGDSSSLMHFWTFSDREDPIENTTSVSRTFSKPGLYSVSLTVIDERGLESAPKTYLLYIGNPPPIPDMKFSCPSDGESMLDGVPDSSSVFWRVPTTSTGGAFVAPGDMIRFDGSGSYDADPEFIGKSSADINDPNWAGITNWIWDFGDATPSETGPIVWHSYERPGEYTVRLTVIDGFGQGDSNTTEMIVIVSDAPKITTTTPISSEYVIVGDLVNLSGEATDLDLERGVQAWMDEDAFFDSDGDGITDNDQDAILTGPLEFKWDINVFVDEDCKTIEGCDGNSRNDWLAQNQSWTEPGEVRISMTVCDGVGVCSSRDYVVMVLSLQDTAPPKTLSDLSAEDLVPGRESAGILFLLVLVAVLGWMIMSGRDDDELDAMDMTKKYDVDEVEAEGGLPGMDQHSPPPQPKYLTPDQRTNKESGYVRPIRTRRR